MAFYPNPNSIPVDPPFGRKGRPVGTQPDRTTGPGRKGNPTDATSSDPAVAGTPEGGNGEPEPTATAEPKKQQPVPDQRDEFATFVSLIGNLVGMRTPMAPEAPRTTCKAP